MEIQKYKAKISGSDTFVVGYVFETREYLGNGSYNPSGSSYLIIVTEKSMPGGMYGTFVVNRSTIEELPKKAQ